MDGGVAMSAVPWIPDLAREFLQSRMLPRWRCFEWGSGGSTRWLASWCQHVTSVEHDERWLMAVPPRNVTQLHVAPDAGELGTDPAEPSHYRSGSTELGPGLNWCAYACAIDGYGDFDLVLVDGRARASCIAHAVPRVRPGGWLVVDNTGDRPWYLARTLPLLEGWDRVTFLGTGPRLAYPWECSAWRRPKND